jgi:hypothetical protein
MSNFNLFSFFNTLHNDAPEPWQLGFQDSASPAFTGIVELHNEIFFFLTVICVGVFFMLFSILFTFDSNKSKIVHKYLNHGTIIELIWTISPALVLIAIAFPSFRLLYLMDEVISPTITIKATGLFDGLINYKYLILFFIFFSFKFFFRFFTLPKSLKRATYKPSLTKSNIINLLASTNKNLYSNFNTLTLNRKFHSYCRSIRRLGRHDLEVISVIFGLLLGDGYGQNRSGEGVRLSIKQSIKHKEYLNSLYQFFYLRGYCSSLKPRLYARTIKGNDSKFYGYEFNTYTFRSFIWIYNSFYYKGNKILPENLQLYFSPLSLAIIIIDDGG